MAEAAESEVGRPDGVIVSAESVGRALAKARSLEHDGLAGRRGRGGSHCHEVVVEGSEGEVVAFGG